MQDLMIKIAPFNKSIKQHTITCNNNETVLSNNQIDGGSSSNFKSWKIRKVIKNSMCIFKGETYWEVERK